MSEIPKVVGAGQSLDAQRFHGTAALPQLGPAASETGGVGGGEPLFTERRKVPDRRKRRRGDDPDDRSSLPFDTRQKNERRKSRALDYEV
ncbi:hypothetical protein [Methylogaea oryzae]|uniref:hypothetical protein n=1 Tax=Methylogaea oryzae TaxID=1295382 RepID=UPI0012E1562F|nr:hypothetical protein [Methylogaea oryzae]